MLWPNAAPLRRPRRPPKHRLSVGELHPIVLATMGAAPRRARAGSETRCRAGTSETYAAWQRDPEAFWREAAAAIDWIEPPNRIFDPEAGVYGRWFPDATLNACFNCLDRHVRDGRGDQAAIVYDAPVIDFGETITYAELLDEVSTFAAVLGDFGVAKGDRVIIYLPMIPRAHVAMLACARIGAIHSVVFGGFSSKELATRIDDAAPKLILTASCGIEPGRTVPYKPLVDAAIDMARVKPAAVIVWQRPKLESELRPGRDHDWATLAAKAKAEGRRAACVAMAATDPLYILYTSGTTGIPKGVVRDTGGYLVALAWSMSGLYDIAPGEVFWCASDVGWVVGHSYNVYAPLLITVRRRSATKASRSAHPTRARSGAFAPSMAWCRSSPRRPALRAIKKEDPEGAYLPQVRPLEVAGAVSRRRARRCRPPWIGRRKNSGCPSSTIGGRRKPAGASPAIPKGLGLLPPKPGSATRADAGLRARGRRREAASRCPRARWAMFVIKAAAAAGLPADALAERREDARELPRGLPQRLQDVGRRLQGRGWDTSSCSGAPTTSSIAPAIGSRPAGWKRCSPAIPMWRNAR